MDRRRRTRRRLSSPIPTDANEISVLWRRLPVDAVSVNVTVVEPVPFAAGVTMDGLKLQATFDGRPLQAKLTGDAKPLEAVTVSIAVAGDVVVAVPLEELLLRLKSATTDVTVTVTAADTEAAKFVSPP
jgi:hypothetical protein